LYDVVHIARPRRIDGMIVGNTTLARPSTLREQARAREQGACRAGRCFGCRRGWWRRPYVSAGGAAFPLVGVGGIDTAAPR